MANYGIWIPIILMWSRHWNKWNYGKWWRINIMGSEKNLIQHEYNLVNTEIEKGDETNDDVNE